MKPLPPWTHWIFTYILVPLAIIMAGEFLIQYNWLGRTQWSPFERMWINLTILSLATIYLVVYIIHAVRWLWHLGPLPTTLVLILAGWCVGTIVVRIFRGLFENPAICWGNDQQLAYAVGLSALAAYYTLRILGPKR